MQSEAASALEGAELIDGMVHVGELLLDGLCEFERQNVRTCAKTEDRKPETEKYQKLKIQKNENTKN